jgi:16S rRNA (uracil1498-N3)-methyltransferase
MALPRFYIGKLDFDMPEDALNMGVFRHRNFPYLAELPDAAAAHVRVLRIEVGEAITLFDGTGGECTAEITNVGKKSVSVSVLAHQAIERESPVRVTIVQALAVGDKMDWIVQKACELGAAEIVPLQTERCTLRLSGERADKRVAHWQQVAVAASEQCGRNRVAPVAPISEFARWLASVDVKRAAYFMLHPQDDCATFVEALKALTSTSGACSPIYLLIGPEGGFSPAEMQLVQQAGVVAVRLGTRVLRTETAAVAALAVIGAVIGDLQ